MTSNTQFLDTADTYFSKRNRMVESQLILRGIANSAVLDAMREVPRHLFVPDESRPFAYEDRPLPLPGGQTISQPYMVAKVTELLVMSGASRVMEVGAGCGYQAAVLARLFPYVFAVEIVPELAALARANLEMVGAVGVVVKEGDGKEGWEEEAPFDAILASCAVVEIPPAWEDQLVTDGHLVFPLVEGDRQVLCRWVKGRRGWKAKEELFDVRYVPLI